MLRRTLAGSNTFRFSLREASLGRSGFRFASTGNGASARSSDWTDPFSSPSSEQQAIAKAQQRQMRRWFDTVISLGIHPFDPLPNTSLTHASSREQMSVNGSPTPNASSPDQSTHQSSSAANPWLRSVVSPMVKEARAILKALHSANATSIDLPDSIMSALWSVFDRLYLMRYRDLALEEKLALEARQYEYFLLMSQAGIDMSKVCELATRIKAEATSLLQSQSQSPEGGKNNYSTVTLTRLVSDIHGAAMPLFNCWLRQSAAASHIVSDSTVGDSTHEFDLHERFGGQVKIGGALGLPGAHGLQKIIMLRAALLKATTRLETRRRNGSLKYVAPKTVAEAGEEALAAWCEERLSALAVLDSHCFSLLKRWMKHGEGIVMRELRWDDCAPAILEKVIAAEVVHPFAYPGLISMRERLQPTGRNRHLFCFFHEGMGFEEPLIAVQVALTPNISDSVDEILRRPTTLPRPMQPTTINADVVAADDGNVENTVKPKAANTAAIFYSINSTQLGLKGVDLGNSLIKAVVKHLKTVYPSLDTFSTLSPIPGYMAWLRAEVKKISAFLAQSIPEEGKPLLKDIHHQSQLERLAKAIALSGSQIFGPCSNVEAAANISDGDEGVGGLEWDHATDHIAEKSFQRNAAPQRPLNQHELLAWLTQISRAIQEASAHTQSEAKAPDNVLEALVELFSPFTPKPPPPTYQQSLLMKKKKKDPIAELYEPPKNADRSGKLEWWGIPTVADLLRQPVSCSIACYLTCEKTKNGKILDPVGNFHVSNGAVMFRVNWMANQTTKGSKESACAMVNYWYDLDNITVNARAYELGRAVPVGRPIQLLWKGLTA